MFVFLKSEGPKVYWQRGHICRCNIIWSNKVAKPKKRIKIREEMEEGNIKQKRSFAYDFESTVPSLMWNFNFKHI